MATQPTNDPDVTYVDYLPDLMTWDDYDAAHAEKRVKVRLRVTDDGIEILADSPYPLELEKLLQSLDAKTIEMMLCG